MLNFGIDQISTAIAFAITAILAFAYHEFAHAIVADRLGDPTPREHGRITLNPIPHLDLMGTVLLLLFGFGWATTPVSPQRLRGNPRTSMAIVAIAGPLANLLMAILYVLPITFGLVVSGPSAGGVIPTPYEFLSMGILINLFLMVFNLLPIPPLDGFTVLMGLLPAEMAYQLQPLRRYGFIILIAVIFLLPTLGIDIFGRLLGPVFSIFSLIFIR